jgi:dCTP deaminase
MKIHELDDGVLPDTVIREFIASGFIKNADVKNVQPASIDVMPDLNDIYEIDYFFLPRLGEKVQDIVMSMKKSGSARKISGSVVEKGKKYLIRLRENIFGLPVLSRMNPKSSPGRTFLHSRLVTDNYTAYDEVPAGNQGDHWLLVAPKIFSIELCETEPLSQMRFFHGDVRLSRKELTREIRKGDLMFLNERLPVFEDGRTEVFGGGIGSFPISVDLNSDVIAFVSRNDAPVLPICKRDLRVLDYFDVVYKDKIFDEVLVLEQSRGYLFGTPETMRMPATLASELLPLSEKYGELRTHFAGFIDPGFGLDCKKGNSVTLEVIAYEPGVCLRHSQRIGELVFEHTSSPPEVAYKGNYKVQESGPKVPKYFSSR